MIKTLIDIEKERFARLGYDAIVSNEDIQVTDTERCVNIGNDTIIITGFVFDADTTCGEDERVSVVSPSDTICDTASNLSAFGISRFKVMRDYIIIKRLNSTALEDCSHQIIPTGTQMPLTISYVRISPVRK